jgi:hypothetical protein
MFAMLTTKKAEVAVSSEVATFVPQVKHAENKNFLPGLHITAEDFAKGLEMAAAEMATGDIWDPAKIGPGDLLQAAYRAYIATGKASPLDDLPEVASALRSGSWVPSLGDLLQAGLTVDALSWMPSGMVQMRLLGADWQIPSVDLGKVLAGMAGLTAHERQEMLGAVAMAMDAFPGSVVEKCATKKVAAYFPPEEIGGVQ